MANNLTADKAHSMLLEEERRIKKYPNDVLTLAAVGGRTTCSYVTAESVDMWIPIAGTSMASPGGAKSNDQEHKRKTREDDAAGAYHASPEDGGLVMF